MIQRFDALRQLISGKDPNVMYNDLMQNNSQFRDFVGKNQGKTIEDIAMEYDVDLSLLKSFL